MKMLTTTGSIGLTSNRRQEHEDDMYNDALVEMLHRTKNEE